MSRERKKEKRRQFASWNVGESYMVHLVYFSEATSANDLRFLGTSSRFCHRTRLRLLFYFIFLFDNSYDVSLRLCRKIWMVAKKITPPRSWYQIHTLLQQDNILISFETCIRFEIYLPLFSSNFFSKLWLVLICFYR